MSDRLTINEAIIAVMKDGGVPLSGEEAYHKIFEKGLYHFHAQQPVSVVVGQIRRHCKDLEFPTAASTKHFGMT